MNTPAWMQAIFLGNSVAQWATAFGWAFGVTAAVVLIRRVVSARLAALAARTDTVADDAVVEAVRSVRKTYVLLIAIGVASSWLQLPGAAHTLVRRVIIVVAVLQAIRSGNAIVDFFAGHYSRRKEGLDRTTLRALSYAGRVVLWVTVIVVALEAGGFEVKTLLTGLGVGGIAIALALQNILGDLFAALSIVLDKPFVVGDAIAVDHFEGEVAHIGLKSTRVRSVNGEEVVFANADLLKSRLRNLTRRDGRRYVITLVLAPGTPAERVARVPGLVAQAVKADGRATLQRSHLVSSGLNGPEIESALLISGIDYVAAHDIRQAVLLGVLQRLEGEGISLARSALVAPDGATRSSS
jgi:small-conductance mechanosensitive channel